MKNIVLTQGQFALVDDEDYDWLNQWKWQATWHKDTKGFYAQRTSLTHEFGLPKTVRMQRQILGVTDPKIQVDHINHNTLDNQRENLRLTENQNKQNSRKYVNNTSGFKGVHLHKQTGKWRARVSVYGRKVSLGLFGTPQDAARAYDAAAKKFHGEFALTNHMLELV